MKKNPLLSGQAVMTFSIFLVILTIILEWNGKSLKIVNPYKRKRRMVKLKKHYFQFKKKTFFLFFYNWKCNNQPKENLKKNVLENWK